MMIVIYESEHFHIFNRKSLELATANLITYTV